MSYRGDYQIPAGWLRGLLRGNKYFQGILPMDEINKPAQNSPNGPLLVLSFIDRRPGFFVPSLLSVIRLMTETHLILMSLSCKEQFA